MGQDQPHLLSATVVKPVAAKAKITIEDLALKVCVGLLDKEKNAPQRILISMDLYLTPDYMQTVGNDSIVDYGAICSDLKKWETAPHIDLLETLAQQAAKIALSYNAVTAARIRIRKPDIIKEAKAVGVEVFVER